MVTITYADLLRFQSGVNLLKDPIHIIIFMKSIIPFFIHSISILTLVYQQEKSKNNNEYLMFTSI